MSIAEVNEVDFADEMNISGHMHQELSSDCKAARAKGSQIVVADKSIFKAKHMPRRITSVRTTCQHNREKERVHQNM
jgi:hypothetical protein